MKKIATITILLTLALSVLSGCFGIPKNLIPPVTPKASAASGGTPAKQSAAPGNSSAPASLKPAGNPSEGYNNYLTVKGDATDRITALAEKSDTLALTVSMSLLGVAMVDMSLLTLTVFTEDVKAAQVGLGFLGFKDIKITANGSDYTMTYKDANGKSVKQTCKYDAKKDQMASTVYDADGKVSIFFEYNNLGNNTYAAQYYYPDKGKYQIIRSYFDKNNVAAYGMLTATGEPASIVGKSGLNADFVKNEETYLVLKDGKLTVFDDGKTTSNS